MTEKVAGHHKTLLSSLTTEQRKQLTGRSNRRGLIPLAIHFGLIVCLWTMVLWQVPGWPLLVLPLGVLIIFLFTLLHETCHRTPFKSKRLNIAVAWVCGFLVLLPPNWFRYFHFEHHRYTQDPLRDPELQSPKPKTTTQYAWHISGLPIWFSHLKTLIINATGHCSDEYVPESARVLVRRESQIILSVYFLIVLALILTNHYFALVTWLLALLAGQPFLRLYLMAEHGRCAFVDNMFENTRTTFTNRLVRQFAWNMPYHAEHHAYPNVPFFNLPLFHELVKEQLKVTSDGYLEFHRDVLGDFNHSDDNSSVQG